MTDFAPLEERIESLRTRVEKLEKANRRLEDEYTFERCRIGDIVEIKDDVELYKVFRKNSEERGYPLAPPSVTLKNLNDLSIITIEKNDFKSWIRLVRRW